jgi:hypothetical protein
MKSRKRSPGDVWRILTGLVEFTIVSFLPQHGSTARAVPPTLLPAMHMGGATAQPCYWRRVLGEPSSLRLGEIRWRGK